MLDLMLSRPLAITLDSRTPTRAEAGCSCFLARPLAGLIMVFWLRRYGGQIDSAP
jgi:hypothetical protein